MIHKHTSGVMSQFIGKITHFDRGGRMIFLKTFLEVGSSSKHKAWNARTKWIWIRLSADAAYVEEETVGVSANTFMKILANWGPSLVQWVKSSMCHVAEK